LVYEARAPTILKKEFPLRAGSSRWIGAGVSTCGDALSVEEHFLIMSFVRTGTRQRTAFAGA
jgi:hypothetical protein